jgi:DNA modification methylase
MTGRALIVQGDALHLPLPDGSVHAICTDPPYGLEFMGKDWDAPWRTAEIDQREQRFADGSANRTGAPGKPYEHKPRWSPRNSTEASQQRVRNESRAYQAWCEQWATEALRVLRPGGWLLACGGTRTWHRLACGIEDAGFEMRDTIAEFGPLAWLYGSGFPKSLDVSKAIDKQRNDRPDILRVTTFMADAAKRAGISRAQVDAHMGTSDMGGWWLSRLPHRCACPTWDQWLQLKVLLAFGDDMDAEVWRLNGRKGTPGEAWEQREVLVARTMVQGGGSSYELRMGERREVDAPITAPATPEAERWQGWGTSLKPSWEPVIVARKPLSGTVAQNVLTFGTGALNIAATRVGTNESTSRPRGTFPHSDDAWGNGRPNEVSETHPAGRWPPNVVLVHDPGCVPVGVRKIRASTGTHRNTALGLMNDDGWQPQTTPAAYYADPDGTETITAWRCVEDSCPVFLLDQQSGDRKAGGNLTGAEPSRPFKDCYGEMNGRRTWQSYADQGGASRFYPTFQAESRLFYTAKAPRNERVTIDGDGHPCVKPLALVRWLVRLVTPPGGVILDMFGGSGTTGEAAMLEGFTCLVIDKDPASCAKAKVRAHPLVRRRTVVTGPPVGPEQGSLL